MSRMKHAVWAIAMALAVAPGAALALPGPQCSQVCVFPNLDCDLECYDFLTFTTCGESRFGCPHEVEPDPPASAVDDAQDDRAAAVCVEAAAPEAQAATAR